MSSIHNNSSTNNDFMVLIEDDQFLSSSNPTVLTNNNSSSLFNQLSSSTNHHHQSSSSSNSSLAGTAAAGGANNINKNGRGGGGDCGSHVAKSKFSIGLSNNTSPPPNGTVLSASTSKLADGNFHASSMNHHGPSMNHHHRHNSDVIDDEEDCVRLRYLCEADVPEIKALCRDMFPVEYPDYWYNDITTDPAFWSMAATTTAHGQCDSIIGICVAEIKRLNHCNFEDRDILAKKFPANTPVCYMLSLGVDKTWRRRGVATLLLDQLLAYIENTATFMSACGGDVKVLYLHVLVTNKEAISFYERRKFKRHGVHRGYYNIGGTLHDGYTYVLYLNGGHPSLSISETLCITCGAIIVKPWKMLWHFIRKLVKR